MPLKKCEMCGSEFQARLSKIRTCSVACRNNLISKEKSARYQKEKSCVVCSKTFHVGAIDANKQTCSTECHYKLASRNTTTSKKVECATCHKEFFASPSAISSGGGKYCSKACMYGRNAGKPVDTKPSPKVTELVEKTCPVCATMFLRSKKDQRIKTCSIECGKKLRLKTIQAAFDSGAPKFPVKKFTQVAIQCEACESMFMVSNFRKDDARFCSDKCAKMVMPHTPRVRVEKVCKCCGTTISVILSRESRTNYCSKACAEKFMRGPDSPHWRGVGVYEYYIDDNGVEKKRKARDVGTAKTAKRNAGAKQATPAWADQKKIRAIYKAARMLTELTGVHHHVDHLVPLNGKTVSGLHNEFNLQAIPAIENLKKHNKHWPDKP